jgi:hypothetical protein
VELVALEDAVVAQFPHLPVWDLSRRREPGLAARPAFSHQVPIVATANSAVS